MKQLLLALAILSLAACATATRMHTVCNVPRFTWTNLGQPPVNSDELKAIGDAGPPQPSDSEAWFSDKKGELQLCRVDLQHQCMSVRRWTFVPDNGQWTVAPGSGLPDLCIGH